MKTLSRVDRDALTRRQITLVDEQLTKEFLVLPVGVVHREVVRVSEGLLAEAHFTDYVAVLTGRFAAEHLRASLALEEAALTGPTAIESDVFRIMPRVLLRTTRGA